MWPSGLPWLLPTAPEHCLARRLKQRSVAIAPNRVINRTRANNRAGPSIVSPWEV
jgi:hypothetical protein